MKFDKTYSLEEFKDLFGNKDNLNFNYKKNAKRKNFTRTYRKPAPNQSQRYD